VFVVAPGDELAFAVDMTLGWRQFPGEQSHEW
jgi:hypothetical protein